MRINEIDQHEPGAKLDQGKVMAALLKDFGPALLEVAKVCTYGCNKYSRDGWKSVPNAYDRYDNAMWRHLLATDEVDESGLSHQAHVIWNALAKLCFTLKGEKT